MKTTLLLTLLCWTLCSCATTKEDTSGEPPKDWLTRPEWQEYKDKVYLMEYEFQKMYGQWEEETAIFVSLPSGEPETIRAVEAWEKKWDRPFFDWISRRTALEKLRPDYVP